LAKFLAYLSVRSATYRKHKTHKSRKTNLVRENHETPIGLTTKYTSNTLSGMSHGIECKELVFPYPIIVSEKLKASFEDTRLRVLIWDAADVKPFNRVWHRLPKHDHSSSIVVVEIDPFGHLPSGYRQHDRSSPVVTSLTLSAS